MDYNITANFAQALFLLIGTGLLFFLFQLDVCQIEIYIPEAAIMAGFSLTKINAKMHPKVTIMGAAIKGAI